MLISNEFRRPVFGAPGVLTAPHYRRLDWIRVICKPVLQRMKHVLQIAAASFALQEYLLSVEGRPKPTKRFVLDNFEHILGLLWVYLEEIYQSNESNPDIEELIEVEGGRKLNDLCFAFAEEELS